mgnify:CR=1 FL=1
MKHHHIRNLSLRSFCSVCLIGIAAVVFMITGCAQEEVAEPFQPRASHSRYVEGLQKMELADTAIGRKWIEASERVLENPVEIELPFREQVFFDPSAPDAAGYEFESQRGRAIRISIDFAQQSELRLFVDLFRVEDDGKELVQVASYDRDENLLEFEPKRDNRYILRLQPELLRGGRYTISIDENPVLAFPVEGKGMRDIHIFFGDPRDGGRRLHEGVDIFAARGTPVLSVSEGTVWRVGTRELGGKTVVVRDASRGFNYYYAHLDVQYAERGQKVVPGDLLGAVGNTGNAITTPPHLHFGIYAARWQALDPWNFLKPGTGLPASLPLAQYSLENYMRTTREVEAGLGTGIPSGAVVRIVAAGTDGLRVHLPGHQGQDKIVELEYEDIESLEQPLETEGSLTVAGNSYLYSTPAANGDAVTELSNSSELTLLGLNGSFYYVETPQGQRGWLPQG